MKPNNNTAKILFFGTPEFAVPALAALHEAGFEIVAVVTQPDKPVGRGLHMESPPIKVKAQELGLTVLQPLNLKAPDVMAELDSLHAELGIVVAYGKLIPKLALDLFPRGVLNIHPSLLPKYRGPSPIQAAILNGDTETGVTIMLLDEKMDHGPVLSHITYHVAHSTRGGELSAALALEGARLLVSTLPKWLEVKITPRPQDHSKATFTKLLKREDGKIEWSKPAEYIERMVRAYDLWPGTWTVWQGKRLKVIHATLLHHTTGCAGNSTPGYLWKTQGRLAVNCSPGSVILEELQLEGKKSMPGPEFLRGYPKFIGVTLT